MSTFIFTFLSGLSVGSAQLTGTGISVVLNDINYFVSPFTTETISVEPSALSSANTIYGFTPVAVIQNTIDEASLPELFANWISTDDVFQEGFSSIVFLRGQGEAPGASRSETDGPASLILQLESPNVPSGPYFLETATGALHQAYRLYNDFSGAFTESMLQTPDGTFQALSAHIASSATATIGVPSRLYYTKTP